MTIYSLDVLLFLFGTRRGENFSVDASVLSQQDEEVLVYGRGMAFQAQKQHVPRLRGWKEVHVLEEWMEGKSAEA